MHEDVLHDNRSTALLCEWCEIVQANMARHYFKYRPILIRHLHMGSKIEMMFSTCVKLFRPSEGVRVGSVRTSVLPPICCATTLQQAGERLHTGERALQATPESGINRSTTCTQCQQRCMSVWEYIQAVMTLPSASAVVVVVVFGAN